MSQWRQLSDEHFKKFSPYPQVFKWEQSLGEESRFCVVRDGGMAGSPCQEIRDVIHPGPRQEPRGAPCSPGGKKEGPEPTATVHGQHSSFRGHEFGQHQTHAEQKETHTHQEKKKVKKLQWAACKTCCVFWWEICRGYARHLLLFESRQRNGIGGRVGKVVVADQGSGSSFLSALEHLSYLWQ